MFDPVPQLWNRLLLALLLVTAIGCDPGPADPGSMPGTIDAVLVTPNDADGAVLIEADAARVLDVRSDDGTVIVRRRNARVFAAVVPDVPRRIRFRVDLADVSQPLDIAVLEVVDGDNVPRASLAGYRVERVR